MKQLLVALISLLFPFSSILEAQVCNFNNTSSTLFISSQKDLNDFATFLPNCTRIDRNVRLDGNDITDLSALQNITQIDGYLLSLIHI